MKRRPRRVIILGLTYLLYALLPVVVLLEVEGGGVETGMPSPVYCRGVSFAVPELLRSGDAGDEGPRQTYAVIVVKARARIRSMVELNAFPPDSQTYLISPVPQLPRCRSHGIDRDRVLKGTGTDYISRASGLSPPLFFYDKRALFC